QTLLEIRSVIARQKPDFEFLKADPLFGNTDELPFIWAGRPAEATPQTPEEGKESRRPGQAETAC
ncbi:hypothetical protein NFI96_008712, partial [Prochilodus magdalenae]